MFARIKAWFACLVEFVGALFHHWKAFVVTAGPGALLGFASTTGALKAPTWSWVALIVVGFFVASWRAYGDATTERAAAQTSALQAEQQANELRARLDRREGLRKVRETLSLLLVDGGELRKDIVADSNARMPSSGIGIGMSWSTRDWSPEVKAWTDKVFDYLLSRPELGKSCAATFITDAGLPPARELPFMTSPKHHWNAEEIARRLARLDQVIRELPNE